MSVEILKRKNQLIIRSVYNEDLINIIRQVEDRFWNKSTREWVLPVKREDWLLQKLNSANIHALHSTANDVSDEIDVAIEKINGKIELKFNRYCDEFPIFRAITSSFYDKERKRLLFPEEQEKNLMNVLRNTKVVYKLMNETEKAAKKITKQSSIPNLFKTKSKKKAKLTDSQDEEMFCTESMEENETMD